MHSSPVSIDLSGCTWRRRGNSRSRSRILSTAPGCGPSSQKLLSVSTPPPSGAVRATVPSFVSSSQAGGNETEYQLLRPVCCFQCSGTLRGNSRILQRGSLWLLLGCRRFFSTLNQRMALRISAIPVRWIVRETPVQSKMRVQVRSTIVHFAFNCLHDFDPSFASVRPVAGDPSRHPAPLDAGQAEETHQEVQDDG